MIEGVIEKLKVGEPKTSNGKTKSAVIITISGEVHTGYIDADKDGKYIPKAQDGTVLGESMVVQFTENKHGEKVYINTDSIVILPQDDVKKEPVLDKSKGSHGVLVGEYNGSNSLNPLQQARAQALLATAMMINALKGTSVKREQAVESADYFVKYIISGKK